MNCEQINAIVDRVFTLRSEVKAARAAAKEFKRRKDCGAIQSEADHWATLTINLFALAREAKELAEITGYR